MRHALVEFDGQGAVVSIGSYDNLDSIAGVEYHDGILIPGMTNAHCHLELSYLLGAVGEGDGLVEFIRQIMAVRGNWTFEQQVERAVAEDRKMWSEGVQAVGDISNGEASFEAKNTSKIAYHTFAEYFNMPPDDQVDQYFAKSTAHIAAAKSLGLAISPTPHSNYMVGDKLFKKSATSERCSIHFMETPSEVDYFDKKGKMYDFVTADGMKPDFLHYGGHAERLIGSLPPDMPLILIHNTMITERQVDQLASYFHDLTFVLCPRSNYFIERAYPPAMMLDRMGVRVAMGTDSLTSNHSLSMAAEIEWLAKSNPELPLATILRWATAGGADGLGMGDQIGRFEVGKRCGAVLLEGVDLKLMRVGSQSLSCRRLL